MKISLNNIWFSDKKRALSASKKIVYSDRGVLKIEKSGLQFEGAKTSFKVENIKAIVYRNQGLNWKTYLSISSIYLLIGWATDNLLYYFLSLVPGVALGILFGWYMFRWTVVVFEENGVEQEAYFADGGLRGWAGFFGGNLKLFNKIKSAYNST